MCVARSNAARKKLARPNPSGKRACGSLGPDILGNQARREQPRFEDWMRGDGNAILILDASEP